MNAIVRKSYRSAGNIVLLEGIAREKGYMPHGEVSISNEKGQKVLQGQYINGKANGKWLRWHDDGTPCSEHNFVLGQFYGVSKQYWENGKLARKCQYGKNREDYEEHVYDKKGNVEKHKVYKKGKFVKAKIKLRGKWHDYDFDFLKVKLPYQIIPEKICYLDQANKLKCKTPRQIWDDLITFVDPELVGDILASFSGKYGDMGLDQRNTVLTSCGGTYVATAISNAGIAPVMAADEHNASVSRAELDGITTACLAATRSGISGSAGNGTRNDQRTRDAVNSIDQVVSSCVDDDNSMIALSATELAIFVAFIGLGGATLGAIITSSRAADAQDKASKIASDTAMTIALLNQEGFYAETEESPGVFVRRSKDGKATITRDTNVPRKTEISVETETVIYNEEDDTVRIIKKKNGEVVSDNTYPASPTNTAPPPQPAPQPAPTPPPPAPPPTPGGGPSMPVDNSGMGKCEQLAAWWAMKKAQCESSNWQTYDCQETLRIFTGCADPALVTPTPDGDGVVCPHEGGMTDEDFRRINCEKKSMVMMPSGFGTQLCVSPGNLHAPSRDICLDPRAQCRPELLIPDEPFGDQNRFQNPAHGSPNSGQRKTLSQTAPSPAFSAYKSIKKVDDTSFDKTILSKDDKTHFVVFASKTCGPCHKVLDVFNDESGNFKKATFNSVDVSQNPELSERYEIRYTPTILVFNKGKLTAQRKVGGASREVLVEYINRAFNLPKSEKPKATKAT